jgi:hypothetical protein
MNYDREKYREMLLDATETVLGYFGLNRTVYENPRNRKRNGMMNRRKNKRYPNREDGKRTIIITTW